MTMMMKREDKEEDNKSDVKINELNISRLNIYN